MSLTSWDDTQRNLGQPVYQMMKDRINSTVPSYRMPQTGPMADADKAILNAWLDAGTPRSSDVCPAGISPDCIGPQCLPCDVTHTMRVYGSGTAEGSGVKFTVPAGPGYQNYFTFTFKNPFAPGETATANAPIIDNPTVIHHFILYGIDSSGQTHVAGWAPGGTNGVLPDDVSMILGFPSFQMQVHYFNNTSQTQQDASGVAFCTTTTPRAHLAGVFTLGNLLFSIPPNSITPVTATCSVTREMTIIGTSPHMHQIGYGFTTTHTRGGQDMGILSNIPDGDWSFDLQKHYPVIPRRVAKVGDILTTTCKYHNTTSAPVTFGLRTQDEMCFDFMTAYTDTTPMRSCSGASTP